MDEQPSQTDPNKPSDNLATPPETSPVSDSGLPGSPTTESMPPTTPASQPKPAGKKGKMLLIVIIALVLAAGAIYFYMKNRNSSSSSVPTASTQVTPATAGDVTSAINAVNSSLTKADSAGDLKSNDLANSSLGL